MYIKGQRIFGVSGFFRWVGMMSRVKCCQSEHEEFGTSGFFGSADFFGAWLFFKRKSGHNWRLGRRYSSQSNLHFIGHNPQFEAMRPQRLEGWRPRCPHCKYPQRHK